jgi:xylulokinase
LDPFFIGVDVGTSGTKAGLFDHLGRLLAHHHVSHTVDYPAPNQAEHDAEAVWWAETRLCIRSIVEQVPEARDRVAGIACSGLGAALVLVDEEGKALRPAILYGIDGRAARQIERLNATFGEEEILRRSGARLSSQSMGPKLLWLSEHEPDVLARAACVLSTNSFLVRRMTGVSVMDTSTAMFYTPFYDFQGDRWLDEWIRKAGLPRSLFPPVTEPSREAGRLEPRAARELDLPDGIPVLAGTIDTYAECVGSNVERPGEALLVYGSSMTLIGMVEELRAHESLWCGRHYRRGTYSLIGAMATSGALIEWFRTLLCEAGPGSGSTGELEARINPEASEIEPGCEGLLALPYFMGERTLIEDPYARGVLVGLTLKHGTAHVYRALLEAVAFAARHNVEEFRRLGFPLTGVVATGGGTRNRLWVQIISDVTGLEQTVSHDGHAVLRGNARMAAEAAGVNVGDAGGAASEAGSATETATAESESAWSIGGTRVTPDPDATDRYDRLYPVFRELYSATAPIVHRLGGAPRRTDGGSRGVSEEADPGKTPPTRADRKPGKNTQN